jgi:hypothetical protein
MPGYFAPWTTEEKQRLAELHGAATADGRPPNWAELAAELPGRKPGAVRTAFFKYCLQPGAAGRSSDGLARSESRPTRPATEPMRRHGTHPLLRTGLCGHLRMAS